MSITPRRQFVLTSHPAVCRVHCIGDSNVYGGGVSFHETQPFRLEDALHQEFPERLFVCANLGHEGWNLFNSVAHHQTLFASEKNPCDLIVLTICNNDAELFGAFGANYNDCPQKIALFKDPYLRAAMTDALAQLKAHAQSFGAKLIVAFLLVEHKPEEEQVSRCYAQWCRELDIPFVDLMTETAKRHKIPNAQMIVSAADLHPNPVYHDLAAKILAQEIKKHALVPVAQDNKSSMDATIAEVLDGMLRHPFGDRQAVYLWAYRVFGIKEQALPRQLAQREDRLKCKQALRAAKEKLCTDWSAWQARIENKTVSRSLYQAMLVQWNRFIPSKQCILMLEEWLLALDFAVRAQRQSDMRARMEGMKIDEVADDGLPLAPRLESVRNRAKSAQEILKGLTDEGGLLFDEAMRDGEHAQACAALDEYLALLCAVTDRAAGAEETLKDQALCTTTRRMILNLIGKTEPLLDMIAPLLRVPTPHPPVEGIEVKVTVKTDKPFDSQTFGHGLGLLFRPVLPANVVHYYTGHAVVTTARERTYTLVLPYFAAAYLFVALRINFGDVDMAHFTLGRVEVSCCYAGNATAKKQVFAQDFSGAKTVNFDVAAY